MPTENEMANKNVIERGGELLEIALDDSTKNQYKIALPLVYDFVFSPLDEKGKTMPVSSITSEDTRTIINVPGNAPQWKLKVIKPEDRSNVDGTGSTSPPTGDENGDGTRFVDWLRGKVQSSDMDEHTKKAFQDAKREIVIRKV